MKAALTGVLNLSVLDGWWDEMHDGENGWAIPTADGVDGRDDLEAAALYDIMENSVAARFYDRDTGGLPARWLEMVRHTLQSLGPKVLAGRMLRDYVRLLYIPSAASSRRLGAAGAAELTSCSIRRRPRWRWRRRTSRAGTGTRAGSLDRTGPFGYTVRVLPRHPNLATEAELGLVAVPQPVEAPLTEVGMR
jgi:starch phosphorylase